MPQQNIKKQAWTEIAAALLKCMSLLPKVKAVVTGLNKKFINIKNAVPHFFNQAICKIRTGW